MKKLVYSIILTVACVTLCGQASKQIKYAPIDFTQSIGNLSANKQGRIKAETWYKEFRNEAGNAYVYMIHKNGGDWWFQQAKKKFPTRAYPQDWLLEEVEKDTKKFKDYNKWAFFIDKKDLVGSPVVLGGDLMRIDEHGNHYLPSDAEIKKMEEQLDYRPKKNAQIEMILYEQKVGSSKWIEISRRKFQTDKEGDLIYPRNPRTGNEEYWESEFISQKLKESNEAATSK